MSSPMQTPTITPFFQDDTTTLYQGDCREVVPHIGLVDAVVSDPPYGLSFMGKEWDHGVPGVEFWETIGEAMKPGAHLLAFGGTRTFHRLAVAIEDAGFEIRDCVMWVYGSGFPKSLNVSKAIERRRTEDLEPVRAVCRYLRAAMDSAGLKSRDISPLFDCNPRLVDHWAARDTDSQPSLPTNEQWRALRSLVALSLGDSMDSEVERLNGRKGTKGEAWDRRGSTGIAGDRGGFAGERLGNSGNPTKDIPATPEAIQWDGWGTALKPAIEYIVCARKPMDLVGLCGILARRIGESVCRLASSAKGASGSSLSSLVERGEVSDSALWGAVNGCNTLGDLFALMDTWPSGLAMPTSLSTGFSWLRTLAEVSQAENTFTTEMKTSLTTDLKILNSSPSAITPDSITGGATGQRGTGSSADLAASTFSVVRAKLATILTSSAPGFVTSTGGESALRPDWRPIIVARKPLAGTVAANVLEHGTGAINVDGCRVESTEAWGTEGAAVGLSEVNALGRHLNNSGHSQPKYAPSGRWPANLIHDGSAEVVELFPGAGKGNASRFFYCPKTSKADRGEFNTHPTVKPTELMKYLCRLVTPPGGTVLDPFMGSGSTGKAATLEGFKFIGIDLDEKHCEIAAHRIQGTSPIMDEPNKKSKNEDGEGSK